MIVIHGRATSSNVQIVMWAIAELGLDHKRLDVGGAFGGNSSPDYLAMNPNALVPVMRDGPVTMFESAAIVRYLGASYGDETFWPRDPAVRGPLDTWAEWGKTTFAPAMTPVFMHTVRTRPADRNQGVIDAGVAQLAKVAAIADRRIGHGAYLAGDRLTFADIVFAHQLYRYFTLDFARAETPSLRAYYDRLSQRPAFAENVMVSYESLRAT